MERSYRGCAQGQGGVRRACLVLRGMQLPEALLSSTCGGTCKKIGLPQPMHCFNVVLYPPGARNDKEDEDGAGSTGSTSVAITTRRRKGATTCGPTISWKYLLARSLAGGRARLQGSSFPYTGRPSFAACEFPADPQPFRV